MKILMLTASLDSGGAETHIFELARTLASRSHELTVASSGGEIAKLLKKDGVRHLNIPLGSKKPHDLIVSFIKLRKLLRGEQFDVVHVHSRIAAFLCRAAIGKAKTPCVVSTVHARFRTTPILRRLSFWGRASVAVSEDLRDFLAEEYSVPYSNITVIPNAIDTERFSKKEPRASCAPKIVFASRLDTDCSLGAILLCRIAPKLAKRYAGLTISIAGGGRAEARISSLAKRANVAVGYKCVSMLGYVTDMPSLLKEADVFVGVSRAALEAMSSGTPVILCGNEGFLGIVDSSNIALAEKTNFCCRGAELPDAISLYNSISALLDIKTSERAALGEHLRDYVCRHHGLASLASLTEAFYKSALKSSEILKKQGDIVLCGYYGFDNIGDDALLISAIDTLRKKYPQKSISVICHKPKKVEKKFGVRALSREDLPAVLREISRAERLVLGGGSILQDETSLRSLRFYTLLIRFAAKRGCAVELLANGLGPLKRKRAQKLAAKALVCCESLSFRDKASASLAVSLGCDEKRITLVDDLSSQITPCGNARATRILARLGIKNEPFVLISIRGKTKRSDRENIEAEIKAKKEDGLFPLFVIMHAKEDKRISKRMAKRVGGKCLASLSPAELIALSGRARIAIGNRYHLLYLTKREGTPIVAYGDDPKILSLIE